MLTQEQIDTVKATCPIVKKSGNVVTSVFYCNLLRENSSLNEVFNQGNQANGQQAKALAGALYTYAANIDNQGALEPMVEQITQKHASLSIKPEQYEVVGKYLLEAFGEVLGDAFTPAIKNAWAAAYAQLADILIGAEKKLYDDAGNWSTWRDFVVREKTPESKEITSFILTPVDKQPLPSYLPGQYISIRTYVPSLQVHQARQYSLSDKPNPKHYRISVKREAGVKTEDPKAVRHQGYVSNVLHDQQKVGDIVQLSRPLGGFYLDPKRSPQNGVVLVSAGVGLTPLISMLNTVLQGGMSSRAITWIHAARNTRVRAFYEHIRELKKITPNLRVITFIENPSETDRLGIDYQHVGLVDLNKCEPERDLGLCSQSTDYFLCGPDMFMTVMQRYLLSHGVDGERIHMERFGSGSIDGAL